MDIFCEYMVKHKKDKADLLKAIGILFLASALTGVLVCFWGYLYTFEVFVLAGIWYGAYMLLRTLDIEYEYIVTNNILDIDKIMSKQARKRMISIDMKKIDAFYAVTNGAEALTKSNVKAYDYTGYIGGKNVYCIETEKGNEKCRVFFQPNDKMLAELYKANPRLVPSIKIEAEV